MYNGILHLHSGLRWVVLIVLIYAIFNAWTRYKGGLKYRAQDKLVNLVAMALLHTQFLIGLVLYFQSPIVEIALNDFGAAMKDSTLRFFVMEHLVLMLAAVVMITIGRKRGQSAQDPKIMHRRILVWYSVVLLVILAAIPWPFRFDQSGWF